MFILRKRYITWLFILRKRDNICAYIMRKRVALGIIINIYDKI